MSKYLDYTGLQRFWDKVKTFLTNGYQPKLVSGTNIKTINNESLLGSGNISVGGGGGASVDYVIEAPTVTKTISGSQVTIDLTNFSQFIDPNYPIEIFMDCFPFQDQGSSYPVLVATPAGYQNDNFDDFMSNYGYSEGTGYGSVLNDIYFGNILIGKRSVSPSDFPSDQNFCFVIEYTPQFAASIERDGDSSIATGNIIVKYRKLPTVNTTLSPTGTIPTIYYEF